MKTLALIASATLAGLSLTPAQTTSETVTTTTAANPPEAVGTLTTFDPSGRSLVVTTPGGASPATYAYDTTTQIVDEAGNPVAADVVKTGAPVTVYYTNDAGHMVASKLVVRHMSPPVIQETHTTTTTTTNAD